MRNKKNVPSMGSFTRHGAVAVDGIGGMPCPLGPEPILGGAVDGIGAVAV